MLLKLLIIEDCDDFWRMFYFLPNLIEGYPEKSNQTGNKQWTGAKLTLYLKVVKCLFLWLQETISVQAAPGSVFISQYTVNPFPAAS